MHAAIFFITLDYWKTNNPQFRVKNHFNSKGSQWTRIYKPIKVLELKPNCDDYDEDKITMQYMNK